MSDEFEMHVQVDEGVLATSAPLPVEKLEHVLRLTHDGMRSVPSVQAQIKDLCVNFTEKKVVGAASVMEQMLAILKKDALALEYFKTSIMSALTGKRIRAFVNPADAVLNDRVSTTIADSEVGDGSSSVRYARPRTRSGSVSTPDGRSLGSLRKRSLETGHAAASPATPSRSDKKIKSESTASTARPSKKQSGAKEIEILDDEEEEYAKHPIYTVPTHWEELYYKPVEIINIHSVGAKDRIQALRFAGTPFVLEGHMGWMKFSEGWVRPNGSLDTDAFLRGIHDVKVPVIERNYEETNPIKTHLPLSHYVKNYWEKGKAEYYMHQWQFPLNPKVAKSLCYKCEELPVIGDNLLLYWLDAVRGDNPLQYFFMGQKSTNSRMHQDPGGLDITIAPIVGTKRVSMLHRSAAKLDSVHETVNFHDVDLEKSPLLAFMPAWQVDIKPGQILFMPEGTFHACENMTACLSYHRFHVDSVNLPGFLASFLAQDSPSINHAEILWNAAHDLMSTLEVNYHASGQLDDQVATLRKLDALRALRHVARVLTLEDVVPTEDSWDWNKLLEDIDYLIGRIDVRAMQRAKKNSNHPALVSGGATTAAAAALAAKGDAGSGKSAAAAATAAALSAATHWEQLALRKGDTIGVQVFEKRNRAQILRIEHDMELVQVHYVDWGSIYDEFLPVSSLFHGGRAKKVRYKKAPNVHEQVWAVWGSSGQFYNAVVLKVVRTNACLVHYLKYENDWDQWILPGNIFKNYSLKERQANATA